MTPPRVCLVCGAETVEAHHPTGRDPQRSYLDPLLTIPLCHNHHALVHDDWSSLGTPDPVKDAGWVGRLTFVERIERRLRRLAVDAGRLAAAYPEWGWIARLAQSFKAWADELASDIAARDRRDPYWRCEKGFYPAAG